MGAAPTFMTGFRTALKLGRVSNLPTLFGNAATGVALSGGALDRIGVAAVALTLFYVGGMYLNDAFDAPLDARERPGRPIPSGEASRSLVFAAGALMLAAGFGLAWARGAGPAGAALAFSVTLYDAVHTRTALSPLVMGLCRLLCYFVAAGMAGGDSDAPILWIGAGGLFCHVVGLTFAARQEAFDRLESIWPLAALAIPLGVALIFSRGDVVSLACALALAGATAFGLRLLARRKPGDISRAVGLLIAAIALYDAALIAGAGAGATALALATALCFPATLLLQRTIPGT